MNSHYILLILFLLSLFITIPFPSLLSPTHPTPLKFDKTTKNDSTNLILSEKHFLNSIDLRNQLNEKSFIGIWNSNDMGQSQFGSFEHSSGKIALYFYQNETSAMNVKMTIRDGDYLDQKVIVANELPLIANHSKENVWTNSFRHTISQFDEFDFDRSLDCDLDYTIKLTDAHNGGDSVSGVANAKISFLMKSENCNFQIDGDAMLGEWSSQSQAIYYSLTVTIVCVIKLVSVIKLIKYGNDNEADLNKISIISVSIATIMDTYMCLFHLYMALYIESFFHFFITPAFWYFILFSIFEMRFLLMLWKARYFATYESIRDVRKGLIFFYVKLYLGLFACLALLYFFVLKSWLIVIFYLFLIPQIVHIAIRRLNSKFLSVYVFGFLGIRIIYPLYFRGCPENLFSLTPSVNLMISVCSLLGLQILVYFLQWKLGSRFFIPAICLPPKYKYFREHKVDLQTQSDFDDCVICMNHLHEDPSDKTQPLLDTENNEVDLEMKKGIVSKKIMITPCGHKYHIPCLKKWIEIKLECPTCRKNIPPVE